VTLATETVDIAQGALAVRLARQGGAILQAGFDGFTFLAPAGGPDDTMASFPLVPFGNRIEHNRFVLDGNEYHLRPNSSDPLVLHGDGWLEPWRIEDAGPAKAVLALRHRADAFSPYDYSARQTLSVSNDCLCLKLSVTNHADRRMPFGLGQHPFFARTPQTRLFARAANVWAERSGHLPDQRGPVSSGLDFTGGAYLPDRFVNNAFDGWDGHARISWPEYSLAAEVEAGPIHDIFMLYLPTDRRDVFCFEPMTHLPNGHHMQDFGGLKLIEGGESISGEITIRIRRD
jgi:aldose 1-epimerase